MTTSQRDNGVRRRGLLAGIGVAVAAWATARATTSERAAAYTAPETTTTRVITAPDGSTRLLYATESPEAWVEDIGRGTLNAGRVEITLEPAFAALIETANYHVFVQAYGEEGAGLTVARVGAAGFTVAERGGGTGNTAFSWRVLAKLRGVSGERLAPFAVPTFLPSALTPPPLPPTPPLPPRRPEPPATPGS